jgi:hypothetical protein
MDEADIRIAVLSWVRRMSRGRDLPVITSEFSLSGTGIRADLAVLADDFIGIEIKSAADTLKRLPAQLLGYGNYFDHTLVVAASRHMPALGKMERNRAEVWSISDRGAMRCQLRGEPNMVAGRTLLSLLTQIEMRRALRRPDETRLVGPIALTHADARRAFEAAFRARFALTSAAFWDQVSNRPIRREDLTALSRFYPERERQRRAKEQQATQWAEWANAMNNLSAS